MIDLEKTIFIIGGGPSVSEILAGGYHDLIAKQKVFTVNNSYKLFPDAILCHFADLAWYRWHTTERKEGEPHIKEVFNGNLSTCTNSFKHFWHQEDVHRYNRCEDLDKINLLNLWGNNSGLQAIQIAHIFGAKNVVLIGFDMNVEGQSHWHNEHRRNNADLMRRNRIILDTIPLFDALAEKLLQHMNIYNTCKTSGLKCFPYKSIEDILINKIET